MEFQVPQFIDIEDKIVGPFTFRQFLYLLGGGGAAFVIYKALPIYLAVLFIVPILALAGALTFYKVNGKPFVYVLESAFNFAIGNKLYIWKKNPPKKSDKKDSAPNLNEVSYIPKLSNSKLKDISWSLDVLDVNKK